MTAAFTAQVRMVPITKLHESKLNPRKHFDPDALADLAASIKAHGVWNPLVVRANAQGYEIGAGARRLRAAKLAGLTEVPVLVKPLDDAAFLELLVFENNARADTTPLEQAEGYKLLMTKLHYDVQRIAAREGKSEKYVYDRVKLLALIPKAQALLRDTRMTAGHAILLARLTPKDQERAIRPVREGGGLFEHEHGLLLEEVPAGDG